MFNLEVMQTAEPGNKLLPGGSDCNRLILRGSDSGSKKFYYLEEVRQGWKEGLLPGVSDAGLERSFATWRK